VALLPVCKITSLIEFRGLGGDAIIQKYEPLQFIDTLAPKPLLILTAEKGARSDPTYACQLFERLRHEYVEQDIEDHLAYSMILGAGHAYHPLMSKMVVDWMQKFLLVEDDGPQFV